MKLSRRQFLSVAAVACTSACRGGARATGEGYFSWGGPGIAHGKFRHPRAIETSNSEVFVVDKTGRLQVFDLNGKYLRGWAMPASDNGTPTAVSFGGDGRVLIADTHYNRVLEYTAQGEMIRQWGAYGTGEEQFIYPTDIAEADDGSYFVAEYGTDAERIHVFDKNRNYVRQWGRLGDKPGEFSRAMALLFGPDGLLYVSDMGNSRVQCFDTAGALIRTIGASGSGPGEVKYPFDIAVTPDGLLALCEYGNNRLSFFEPDGAFRGSFGRAGRGPGEFNGPRGIAITPDGWLFVADTDNHRVQRFRLEALGL